MARQLGGEKARKHSSFPPLPIFLAASQRPSIQASTHYMNTKLQSSRTVGVVAILVAAMLLAGFAHVPILREIASFLIIEDSLEPAAAIVSLGGEGNPPWREIEAARLYHAGWAPRIVIVRGSRQQGLGIDRPPRELSRKALIREGVPASAILLIQDDAQNTL